MGSPGRIDLRTHQTWTVALLLNDVLLQITAMWFVKRKAALKYTENEQLFNNNPDEDESVIVSHKGMWVNHVEKNGSINTITMWSFSKHRYYCGKQAFVYTEKYLEIFDFFCNIFVCLFVCFVVCGLFGVFLRWVFEVFFGGGVVFLGRGGGGSFVFCWFVCCYLF